MDIEIALITDVFLLISSLWLILRISQRSIFNPSLWWVALHAYSVTFRLVTLNLGIQSIPMIGIRSESELVNAAIASDISLMGVVVATMAAEHRALRDKTIGFRDVGWDELNPRLGNVISILCLAIGTFFLLRFASATIAARARGIDLTAIDIGNIALTTYPYTLAGFAVQAGIIQVALRGFTPWTFAMLLPLLAASSLYLPRTVFVLATIMAFLIYQTQRNRMDLPAKAALGALLFGLLWFVYKPIDAAINEDRSVGEVIASARDYLRDSGNSLDHQFLDMQATFMAAADETGRRFYGATVLPLMYLPIPRFIWPDKPRLNEYAVELSSPLRPMVQVGMYPMLSGESYLNFGWVGCAAIPFLYVLAMQTAFQRIRTLGSTSSRRFIYAVLLISTVQVFRDGLPSLFLYSILSYLPLIGWGVVSQLVGPVRAYGQHSTGFTR
jgi:hypothetical protein